MQKNSFCTSSYLALMIAMTLCNQTKTVSLFDQVKAKAQQGWGWAKKIGRTVLESTKLKSKQYEPDKELEQLAVEGGEWILVAPDTATDIEENKSIGHPATAPIPNVKTDNEQASSVAVPIAPPLAMIQKLAKESAKVSTPSYESEQDAAGTVSAAESAHRQPVLSEAQSDVLAQIRQGIKLKKVTQQAAEEKSEQGPFAEALRKKFMGARGGEEEEEEEEEEGAESITEPAHPAMPIAPPHAKIHPLDERKSTDKAPSRNDLLAAIRQGIKLKKVTQQTIEKGGAKEGSDALETVLSQQRQFMQFKANGKENGGDDEDGDNWDE